CFRDTPDTRRDGSRPKANTRNSSRHTFPTNAYSNTAISIINGPKISQRFQYQSRTEFSNNFNQHALTLPVTPLASPRFGVATSTVNTSREIEFGLRVVF